MHVVENHVYKHSCTESLKKTHKNLVFCFMVAGWITNHTWLVGWLILMSVAVPLKSMKQMDAEGAVLISVLRTEIYKSPGSQISHFRPYRKKIRWTVHQGGQAWLESAALGLVNYPGETT